MNFTDENTPEEYEEELQKRLAVWSERYKDDDDVQVSDAHESEDCLFLEKALSCVFSHGYSRSFFYSIQNALDQIHRNNQPFFLEPEQIYELVKDHDRAFADFLEFYAVGASKPTTSDFVDDIYSMLAEKNTLFETVSASTYRMHNFYAILERPAFSKSVAFGLISLVSDRFLEIDARQKQLAEENEQLKEENKRLENLQPTAITFTRIGQSGNKLLAENDKAVRRATNVIDSACCAAIDRMRAATSAFKQQIRAQHLTTKTTVSKIITTSNERRASTLGNPRRKRSAPSSTTTTSSSSSSTTSSSSSSSTRRRKSATVTERSRKNPRAAALSAATAIETDAVASSVEEEEEETPRVKRARGPASQTTEAASLPSIPQEEPPQEEKEESCSDHDHFMLSLFDGEDL